MRDGALLSALLAGSLTLRGTAPPERGARSPRMGGGASARIGEPARGRQGGNRPVGEIYDLTAPRKRRSLPQARSALAPGAGLVQRLGCALIEPKLDPAEELLQLGD